MGFQGYLQDFLTLFSAREKAAYSWGIIFVLFLFLSKGIRKPLLEMLKMVLKPPLLYTFLITLLYSLILIYLITQLGFYYLGFFKDATIWFFGFGLITALNSYKVSFNKGFFKKQWRKSFNLGLILEFLSKFYSFDFIKEFCLFPFLAVVIATTTYIENKPEHRGVKNFLNVLLFLYFGLIFVLSINQLVDLETNNELKENLIQMGGPLLLIALFFPLIFGISLYLIYNELFHKIKILLPKGKKRSLAKWHIVIRGNLKFGKLRYYMKKVHRLHANASKDEIKETLS